MKTFLLTAFLALVVHLAGAQNPVSETKVKYQKSEKRAVTYEVPYEQDVAEKAFEDRMSKLGARPEKSRGYTLYRNVQLDENSTDRADVYVKIDRKSRKEKASIITLFALAPNANPAEVETDESRMDGSRTFLNNISPNLADTDHEFQVRAQEEKVSDAEKKMRKLEDDYADLEKKVKNLQDKMEKNRKDQEMMKVNIENERNALQSMRLKGKSGTER